jgi:5-(carboxyamino)imidazole ribonucleotide synthase
MKIGVLGAGQLGRMLALAGYPLGLQFRFLDPAAEAPAEQLAERIIHDFRETHGLERFLAGLDYVTYEFENVPVELAHWLDQRVPVYPPPAALEASQDRLTEKTLFQRLGLPTAPFVPVQSREELLKAVEQLGCPAILKTRRFGYDGKGQHFICTPEDVEKAWRELAGVPLLLEGFIEFDREVSQLSVRGRDGATAFYPLVENHHEQGILRRSIVPVTGLKGAIQNLACDYATRVLQALNYVGVLAIEFFCRADTLIANEMAPRVHNSGHWTIEGAPTSQFENHLRAILGWPLGSTALLQPCALLNLVGELPDCQALLSLPDVHVHLYGKLARPGRKLGHVTVRAATQRQLRQKLKVIDSNGFGPQRTVPVRRGRMG